MRKYLLALAALALIMTTAGVNGAWAQASINNSSNNAVAQAIGARTRAEITRLSIHSSDVDRALRLQSEGDQALRRGEPVRAAEEYGRAEEAVSVLERDRLKASDARALTHRDLERARRAGNNVAQAENFSQKGDNAFENGNYTSAEAYYAIARADLSSGGNIANRSNAPDRTNLANP